MNDIKNKQNNVSVDNIKCFAVNTPMLKYDCSIVPIEKLKIGDTLIGSDSKPSKIVDICRGHGNLYRVDQHNGSSYTVTENHTLVLKIVDHDPKKEKNIEMSVGEYMKLTKIQRDKLTGFKTYIKLLECNDQYTNSLICDYNKMYKHGLTLANLQIDIPAQFKYCSIESRLHLLAGIIDNVGKLVDDFYEILSEKKHFVDSVVFLARSIGFRTYMETKCCTNNDGIDCDMYKISIINEGHIIIPVRKETNIWIGDSVNYIPYVTDIAIAQVENGDYVGFQLDNDGKFIWVDCTVMHN